VQMVTDVPDVPFAILADRRNGVDRLRLAGTLDRSSLPLVEHSVTELSRAGGALVLDLHNVDAVEINAVRALRAIARRADDAGGSLFIVHSREQVRDRFEGVGAGDLLSADVSADLAAGAGDWVPISLPPFPGQRVSTTRLRVIETQA
jgi:anti-anti-sigma factor